MKFLGKILSKKEGEKYHSVVISDLGIFTQGKSHRDCIMMAKDALEELLEIKIEIHPLGKSHFTVTSQDLRPLIARFLENLREESGLTIKEVTQRLGKTSPNFYAQYEQGKSLPGLDLLSEFVRVLKPENDIILSVRKTG